MDAYQIHAMRIEDRLKRLLDSATVTESGCMEVNIAHSVGYPVMTVNGKTQKVSRLLMPFLMAVPRDIAGLVVMHTCDNKRCINPEHLRLGTQSDNMQDAVAKGIASGGSESRPGERSSNAKLNWPQVREIRRLYATGNYSQREIAYDYGIGQGTVKDIVKNVTWKE